MAYKAALQHFARRLFFYPGKTPFMNRFFTAILICCMGCSAISAQSIQDTLATARALHNSGKLHRSEKLLRRWCAVHPQDAGAWWLRAQNEYWRKHFRHARRHFQTAQALDPKNNLLRLDYTETLLGMGRFGKARKTLQTSETALKKDPYFQYLEAKQLFWTGDSQGANKRIRKVKPSGLP